MAQINKPNEYFNTKIYTGNSSTLSVTGVGFQPDWTWIKDRNSAGDDHALYDAVRGATKRIRSNQTDAENTQSNGLTSFDSDGFTVGTNGASNGDGEPFVAWNWLASNTTASNTDGSITSTVSANTTSGFSIVSYTGNGTAGETIGTGLNAVPSMVIVKNRDSGTDEWEVYFKGVTTADNQSLFLNLNSALSTRGNPSWDVSEFSSSVFGVGSNSVTNNSGANYIAYCFAEKKGFSKFGSYTGNGNADGTFVYTGFKPAFVITKCTSTSSTYTNWGMFDSKRPGYNQIDKVLGADLSDSENGSTIGTQYVDFLSNGFKCRNNGSPHNISGESYIYMCFAESPLVGTNNTPATAR